MNRLTKKENGMYQPTHNNEDRQFVVYDLCKKLGKIEDLETELGCPLEVVFKAIEDGIVIVGDLEENGDVTLWSNTKPEIFIGKELDFEEPRLIKYEEWCFSCESGSYSGCVKLRDYGKTWWLKSEVQDNE